MKYRDMSELCTCYTTLDDFQAELNHDADVAYQEGIVATTKYYKDFETGFIVKISYGYDEDAMWWKNLGFKLKEQTDGNMDLNTYVYEFAKLLEFAVIYDRNMEIRSGDLKNLRH